MVPLLPNGRGFKSCQPDAGQRLRLMTAPLIYYKPCSIGDTFFRECLTCGAIVKNEGLHTLYHEQQASPKRCPKCGLLDIGRHACPKE